jgi:GGDEF domain-containing protein
MAGEPLTLTAEHRRVLAEIGESGGTHARLGDLADSRELYELEHAGYIWRDFVDFLGPEPSNTTMAIWCLTALGATSIGIDPMRSDIVSNEVSAVRLDDQLTGFGNRHKLMADLGRAVAAGSEQSVLAIFDLAGLEQYRRVLGQQAGDALIVQVSRVFRQKIGRVGTCYRPREDEFAALIDGRRDRVKPLLGAAEEALRREGEALLITSSFGVAQLPDEADDPIAALALADQRLGEASQRLPRDRRKSPRDR